MRKKKKTFHKRIDFGKQPLIVFSKFVTHPVTGLSLEDIEERLNFAFLDELAPPRKVRGRPPLPFPALCKMIFLLFCERFPTLTDLSRKLASDKRLREFCGFQQGKTPSKQKISQFLITLPEEKQRAVFGELHRQLQRVEYVENDTLSVDGCVFKTVNKRKDRPKIEKRNNETGRMKSVHGIKQVVGVLAQRGICTGFINDFEGRHDSIYYEDTLEQTAQLGYDFNSTAADKAFDSTDLRWRTLLFYGAEAIIPKREYKKKSGEQKKYKNRRRNLSNFTSNREQLIYNDRTAVERYFSKLEIPLGLGKLKTKRDESGATLLNFAHMYDAICRTVHLYKTLENAMVPIS